MKKNGLGKINGHRLKIYSHQRKTYGPGLKIIRFLTPIRESWKNKNRLLLKYHIWKKNSQNPKKSNFWNWASVIFEKKNFFMSFQIFSQSHDLLEGQKFHKIKISVKVFNENKIYFPHLRTLFFSRPYIFSSKTVYD